MNHRTSGILWLALSLGLAASVGNAALAATGPQGRWAAGVAPSYTYVVMQDRSEPKGGGASLFVSYAITDAVSLRVCGLWSGHSVAPTQAEEDKEQTPGGLFQVVSFSAGFGYAIDTLPLTPSIEAGVGVIYQRFAEASAVNLGVVFGLGIDYWLRPWIGLGAGFHYHAFMTNLAEYPVYFDAGPRVSVRWH